MTKKKILVLALTIAMVAILAVGGSLAYLTSTDSATNVFTVGKVDISINEVFDKDNAVLKPGSQKKNAIKKEVKLVLDAQSEDAYVWYEWLIPTVLDSTDGSTGTNNIVHVNSLGSTWDKYKDNSNYWPEGQKAALDEDHTWDHTLEKLGNTKQGFIGTETIDGISYNKYVSLYHGKLSNKEGGQKETTVGMSQVYMDSKVDTDATGYSIKGKHIDYDFTKGVNIIVRAYAIQADGFEDVYAAYNAYQAQK